MGTYEQQLKQLNEAQRKAVETIDGPLMVIAGPGTGKTQLLSTRVAYILKHTDANPANILCLTFTEAAARNMRERLVGLIGEAAYHVGIYTFHSFGTDIIQRYPEYFIDQPLVTAVDELSAYELLSQIFDTLPHRNPLTQKLGDDYIHLRDTSTTISWLKQAGITPGDLQDIVASNEAFLAYCGTLFEVFAERPSPKLLGQYQKLAEQLGAYPNYETCELARLMHEALQAAINETDPSGRYAKPITAWRDTWLIKNQVKHWLPVDQKRTNFLKAVADIYAQYQSALEKRGWYTFDDMILRTIKALQDHDELRLTLQEQYQYIMVDEYQDTNGSQNRLLELLADNPVHEGRPNLMVVGDDDQAIYRFQGAEMSLMLDFLERWREPARVVLTVNYRSGEPILSLSRKVIVQGENRLENHVNELSKQLTSGITNAPSPTITYFRNTSLLDQYAHVAQEISARIKAGEKPSDIAVLAPKHRSLKALVPYLLDLGIPVSYERREHILDQPHIVELIELAQLVQATSEGKWETVNALMPTVLSGQYWQLDPTVIWQLSLDAYAHKKQWVELMQRSNNKTIQQFAQALLVLATEANHLSLEGMFDYMLGNRAIELPNDQSWHIPYRQTYFTEKRLERSPQEYFTLLGQLTSLRERLREYHPGQQLKLRDFISFVQLYEKSKLPLLDTNPHATNVDAVELMTAYKAKGLEWNTVFLIDTHNDVWGTAARSGHNSFGLPTNLSWIKPARDTHDDRLRLFYVALTRAKHNLVLTGFEQTLSGKQTEPIAWLTAENIELATEEPPANPSVKDLIRTQEIQWGVTPARQADLRTSLQSFLERYKLSATHLNDFVDVTKGGPRHFFFRHILHFPEALAPSAVYGSAIHQALHYLHTHCSRRGTLPKLAGAQKIFQNHIQDSGLPVEDKARLLDRGKQALEYFYTQCGEAFKPTDKSEYSFASEGVTVGEARLTGKIDLLRQLGDNKLEIVDYKTGKPLINWRPAQDYGQIRAHLYQQQLAFYTLMVQGAANFTGQSVAETALQFVEPDENGEILSLNYDVTTDDQERLRKLIGIIWQHIMNLDFPDTSGYSLNLKGVLQFEDDLLNGKL